MNVRSFTDLDDILIESSTNVNQNSSYDEDLFEDDSPSKERFQSAAKSERYDSSFESVNPNPNPNPKPNSNNVHQPSTISPSVVEQNDIVIEKYDINDAWELKSTSSNEIQPNEDDDDNNDINDNNGLLPVDDNNTAVPAGHFYQAVSTFLPPKDASSDGGEKVIPPASCGQNAMTGGQYIKNKSQFSQVQPVSDKETLILSRKQLEKKAEKTGKTGKNVGGDTEQREDMIHALQEMLLVAADRIEVRNSAIDSVAARSVVIKSTRSGLSNQQARRIMNPPADADVFGIPDYDPDYDCALEMMQTNLLPYHKEESEGDRDRPENKGVYLKSNTPYHNKDKADEDYSSSSSHKENKNNETLFIRSFNLKTQDYEYVKAPQKNQGRDQGRDQGRNQGRDQSIDQGRDRSRDSRDRDQGRDQGRDHGQEVAKTLMEEMRERDEIRDLLRLGVDRNMLSDKSEEIHSSFLRDLLEICRSRSSESTSIEELAMHRALAAHIKERFLSPGALKSARANMVATAIEVSLKYPAIKKVTNKLFAEVKEDHEVKESKKEKHKRRPKIQSH